MVPAMALQAKFAAEASPYVGADTLVYSVPEDRSQKILLLNPEGVAPMHELWKEWTDAADLGFLRDARDLFQNAL